MRSRESANSYKKDRVLNRKQRVCVNATMTDDLTKRANTTALRQETFHEVFSHESAW